MINRNHMSLDTSIMQSKTVENICLILKDAMSKKTVVDLKEATKFIIQKQKVANLKYGTVATNKGKTRTTVDSKIRFIDRSDK